MEENFTSTFKQFLILNDEVHRLEKNKLKNKITDDEKKIYNMSLVMQDYYNKHVELQRRNFYLEILLFVSVSLLVIATVVLIFK